MAELQPRSALAEVWAPGRRSETGAGSGVTVTEQPVAGCVQLAARAGSLAALIEAMHGLGLTLPEKPGWREGGGWRAVWVGPERWLLLGTGELTGASGLASVSDQSDGRVLLRLSGLRVRDALAKMLPIDLHPRAFSPGDAAVTQAGHIGVTIWQLDEAPTYDLAVARSYAADLAAWLVASAAEYGLRVK